MKNEFEQHKGANNALIGTILAGTAIFLGKKIKEKRDEKKEEVILKPTTTNSLKRNKGINQHTGD